MITGQQIRQARKAAGMSQQDLATAIGMPGGQAYIARIEMAPTPSMGTDMLQRLGMVLGFKVVIEFPAAPEPQEAVKTA